MEKKSKYKIVSVLLSGPYNKTFDYIISENCSDKIGQLVVVPFRNREIIGIIFKKGLDNLPIERLKKVKFVVNLPLISKIYMDFIDFFSDWNCVDKGNVLKLIISPFDKKTLQNLGHKNYKPVKFEHSKLKAHNEIKELNQDQKYASKKILGGFKSKSSRCFLLDGVAGSGKTETYFEAVKYCLQNNKQALILLPEIGLTSDWELRFQKSFGFKALVWHSGITKSRKKKIWLSALFEKSLVVVGARSALFLPFKNLGLIVIDEEHDSSFKQDEGIKYHARDMSVYLASKKQIPIVLSSATPSIETLFNVKTKKFSKLNLFSRATGSSLPEIKIIDLNKSPPKKDSWLSEVMINELKKRFRKNEQSLIFLNRRGYSALTLCRKCGYRVQCKNCNSWLVEHKKSNTYLCHHCGFKKLLSKKCENCNETEMVSCGPGVEKITEEIQTIFPTAIVENISSDSIKNLDDFNKTIEKISLGNVNIIVGTQILAKGYDFPKLNFVGIVDGDVGLYGGDLRSSEKCFQLLSQVSGRAGRHIKNEKGLVFLQTYYPGNSVIKSIKKMDRKMFFKEELSYRKSAFMPPFSRLISIILSSKSEKLLNEFSFNLLEKSPKYNEISVLGPAPAPLNFVRGRYRMRFLVRSSKNINLQNIVRNWIGLISIPGSIRLNVDVEPHNFM